MCINTLHKGDSDDMMMIIIIIIIIIIIFWNLKCTVIPIIIRATGVVMKSLRKNL
jgi:hypothetical protein